MLLLKLLPSYDVSHTRRIKLPVLNRINTSSWQVFELNHRLCGNRKPRFKLCSVKFIITGLSHSYTWSKTTLGEKKKLIFF